MGSEQLLKMYWFKGRVPGLADVYKLMREGS